MLRFIQSTKDHHNTEFILEPDGQVAVKVHTELPLKELTANTMTIDVVKMDEVVGMPNIDLLMSHISKVEGAGAVMHHQSVERIGEMAFHTYSERMPKVRLMRGKERDMDMSEYLERNGYGKKRRFVASPSGCAYTWSDFRLRLDDNREVGRFYHRKSRGLFSTKHPAYLELENEQIMDIGEIVLTLVCLLHESAKHAHVHV